MFVLKPSPRPPSSASSRAWPNNLKERKRTPDLKIDFRPIILAGGSGTRFWPRSRKARAKQVLALDGERTMIQRTADRLEPIADACNIWVITNDLLSATIGAQL